MKINEVVLLEADRAAQNAQEINWKQFKTNLAGYAASMGNSDSNRMDAIVWLGLAGHRKAVKLWAPGLGSKAKIKSQAGTMGFHSDAGGVYNRYIDQITVNPKYGSIYDFNHTTSFILAHELRHRGFNIIRNISALKSQMPNDIDLSSALGNTMNDEHKMLYAIDGLLSSQYGYDEDYWARKYLQCNAIVRNWLSSQPVPKDAPEAFRKDLERIYGKPVEIVAPGEKPKTPVNAIKSGDVKVVQAPEKVAKGAKLPGFIRKLLGLDKKKEPATTTPAPTSQQTKTAKQSGGTQPAAQPAQQKKAAAAVARVKPKSKSKIGTDAGDGMVWIVAKNSNGFTRVRPDDPRVAQQKAAAGIA